MKLFNKTRSTVISTDLQVTKTLVERSLGLLDPRNSRSLLIKTRFGIHTVGLKKPIDLLILDNKKVVKLKKSLQPNRIFFWNPVFNTVVELPEEAILASKTKIGDTVYY